LGTPPPSKPEASTAQSARYGIDRAIQLMRSLPTEQNPELVAMVIANTLSSLELNVAEIIEDARARAADLEARIGRIKARNDVLEQEIELGVDEIVALEASLAEITSVQERLELAHNHRAPDKTSAQ
jgi:hypothetical protein